MGKKSIRLLGLLLSGSMILSMSSVPVYASQTTGENKQEISVSSNVKMLRDTSGQWDNEELYDEYVESLFYKQQKGVSSSALSYDKARLNEDEKWLYNKLAAKIKKVAAGDETRTEFTIEIPDTDKRFTWTAAECGVSSFTNSNVQSKVSEKFNATVNYNKVWQCLLSNMPYELYWHDKTVRGAFGINYSITGSAEQVSIPELKISLAVNAKYAAKESGVTQLYKTNLDKSNTISNNLQRAEDAASYAATIVEANKNYSDYVKLKNYMTAICDLNTYNEYASEHHEIINSADEGIDPWQLVYVFDQDSNTNVVCEGYAKAFAYLCERTNFNSSSIACYTVSGTLAGGTGAGGHMWNIVTMDDGNNYLVDVTNCDGNSIGSPDQLFLAALPGSAATLYTYTKDRWNTATFQYDSEIKDLYGTDSSSILTLKRTDSYTVYTPSVPVDRKDISTAAVQLSASSFTYTGEMQKPNVTVTMDGHAVDPAAYRVSIISADNGTNSAGINAGTVTLQITAKEGSDYTGSVTKTYQIIPAETTVRDVRRTDTGRLLTTTRPADVRLTCTAEAGGRTVAGAISLTDAALQEGTHSYHWKFTPSDGRNYKEVTGTVELTVERAGSSTTTKQITSAMVSSVGEQKYTGSAIRPEVTVMDAGVRLVKGRDYEVSYSNNIQTASAGDSNAPAVTVTGKGSYRGTVIIKFTIAKAEAWISLSNLSQTEGSVSAVTASLHPYSGDARASVEYCVTRNGREEWTSTVPTTVGTYKVRAYLSDRNAGRNLIGHRDYETAAAAGRAVTGTLTVNGKSSSGGNTTSGQNTNSTKTVSTHSDGSTTTTIKTIVKNSTGNTEIIVTVDKDRNNKIISTKTTVTVPEKNNEAVLSGTDVQTIGRDTEGTQTKITVKVTDQYGNQRYTVQADSGDLYVGHALYIFKSGTNTPFMMVNNKEYCVSTTGSVTLDLKENGDYVLVNAQTAKNIEKAVKASIQIKKNKVKVKKGKTTKAALRGILDKESVEKITYSTTNKKVIQVSKNGTVRAKKKGTAYVKVKVVLKNGSSKTVKMKVTVK